MFFSVNFFGEILESGQTGIKIFEEKLVECRDTINELYFNFILKQYSRQAIESPQDQNFNLFDP